jgi:hypothetical protein
VEIPYDAIDARLVEGKKLVDAGKFQEARAIFKAITEEYPAVFAGWVNLGACEDDIGRQSGGLFGGKEAYARALSIRMVPEIMNDMANILLRNELRWEQAEMFYREVVIRNGLEGDAIDNFAVCLLNTATVKRTPEAWREAWQWYERRTLNKLLKHPMKWRGEPLRGKRIVVHLEQGFGDHIWALRFAKQAKEEGAEVIVLAHPNTLRLCLAQPYIDGALNEQDKHEIPSDYVSSSMSLPGYMLLNSLPSPVGKYIASGLPKKRSNKLRIGLAWNGSVNKGYQAWRNIPLEVLRSILAAIPGAQFVSLQKGLRAADAKTLGIEHKAVDAALDLWDTARIIETLDLVITADTLIPHLSAALGVKTWLLDRWSSCWQWGIGPVDPHWYEHLTIYRQDSFGDWDSVVRKVIPDLKKWSDENQVLRGRRQNTHRLPRGLRAAPEARA